LEYLPRENIGRPQYRVKFPEGVGYVRVQNVLNSIGDGALEASDAGEDKEVVRLDKKFKLLFGTESIYLFIRLYTSLVSLLDDISIHVRDNPRVSDPSASYYDPMNSQEEDGEKENKKSEKFDFRSLTDKLEAVLVGKVTTKEYETYCRQLAPDAVHKIVSLPRLIERAADTLKQTSDEDKLLQFFEHCQFTGVVSAALSTSVFRSFQKVIDVPHRLLFI